MSREANRLIFEGKWDVVKGKIKQAWGKLTDDDLKAIEGDQQELFGRLKEKYGYSKEQTEKAIKDLKDMWRRD